MLKRNKHKVLLITGETNKTEEVLGAMADDYKKWAEYDVVIYSPAITGGLDYYHKGVFHNIVAVACNKTNMSGDFYQMLGRIRHPIDNNIYLFYRNYNTATIESETQYLRQLSASLNDRQKRDEIATLANWTYGQYGAVNVVANDYIKLLAKNKVEQNKHARHWIQNLIKYFILANYEINDLNEPDASYPTIEEAIIAEAVIKKEVAKTLFEARNITDAEYNEMKKNKEGKEWTPTEEAEFKKARIKREMLKPISNTLEIADEPANSLFYKIFDDDRLRAYIWNYRPYNKNVEDKLSEGLNYIKQREQNRDEKNRLITDEQGNPTDCGVMEYAFNTINTERRYNKHINLIQLIGGLGINDIWDFKAKISAEHLKETIKRQEWLAKADELVLYTTDTKKQKKIIDHMNTTTNKTFLRDTLYFINSALKAEWGVSIIATNKHATYYQLAPNKTLGAMFKKEGELKKINGWPYLGE